MLVRSALLGLALVTPASADQFYIVQDVEKRACVVSQELPKDDAHAVVGDGAYDNEAIAAADMRKMLACNLRDAAPQAPTGLRIQ